MVHGATSNKPVTVGLLALLTVASACRRRGAEIDADPAARADNHKARPARFASAAAPGGLARVVASIAPAVVHLSADKAVRGGPADWVSSSDPVPARPPAGLDDRFQRALGSGVVFDSRGHVLTNAHIVGARQHVWAYTQDQQRMQAKVVGLDERTDLALLRLEPGGDTPLPRAAPPGDSEQLQVGDWLLAISNPLGTGPRAAVGIVSAMPSGDGAPAAYGVWGFIQADMTIDAGSSGGAVVSTAGELVGIATAVRSQGTHRGVGYILPLATARQLVPLLQRSGRVRRGWIGMYVEAMSEQQALHAGLDKVSGARVSGVVAGGPAEQAGLRQGDIILNVDRKAVTDATQLAWEIAAAGPDRVVTFDIWRDEKRFTLTVRTQAAPE